MTELIIPGKGRYVLDNIVFDYNGTLAVDGKLDGSVKEKLIELSKDYYVYILTADTYGTVKQECASLDIDVMTFPSEKAGSEKEKIIRSLGAEKTVAVGNGFNDIQMFKESVLALAVIGQEGCSCALISHADLIFNSIFDVFEALNNPDRIKAGLRS